MTSLTLDNPIFVRLANAMRQSEYISFVPVEVKHGRKFKGFGYAVDTWEKSNGGFSGSGVRPLKYIEVVKVWIPDTDTFDEYNNFDPDEKVEIAEDRFMADFLKRVNGVLAAADKRCGSDLRWKTNYIRKVLGVGIDWAQELVRELS